LVSHFLLYADQFIACGRTGEKAHDLASKIWLAVIDGLEENQQTVLLLKHLAREGEVRYHFHLFAFSLHTKNKEATLDMLVRWRHYALKLPKLLVMKWSSGINVHIFIFPNRW